MEKVKKDGFFRQKRIISFATLMGIICLSPAFKETETVFANDISCEDLESCEQLMETLNNKLTSFDQKIEEKEQLQEESKTTRENKTQEVEVLRDSVLKLKKEIETVEKEIKKNEERQTELENEIKAIRDRINTQMIIAKREKSQNLFFTFLSETSSLTDLIKNFRTFEYFSRQSANDISQLKVLVDELNQIMDQLESDKKTLVDKQIILEEKESVLLEEIQNLIEYEKQLDSQIQELEQEIMSTEEIKEIVRQQRNTYIAESDDYFGLPTEHGYVTCELGGYRDAKGRPHSGIDIGNYGNTSTKIYASLSGVVTTSGWHNSYGNYIMITHNINGKVYTTLYAHLSQKPLVKVGDTVTKGEHIGYMGATGNATGVHLHFEIYEGYYRFPYAENPRDYVEFPAYW